MVGGLLLAFAVLAALEVFLSSRGSRPSVKDNEKLWSHERRSLLHAGPEALVLVGSSRMALGFSPEGWQQEFPGQKVVQLAINGSTSLPLLRDLAGEPGFRGRVICEIEGWHLVGQEQTKAAQDYVDYYRKYWVSPFQDFECLLRAKLQSRLALLREGVGYGEGLKNLWRGNGFKLKPYCIQVGVDRCMDADYTRIDVRQQEMTWLEHLESQTRLTQFTESQWLDRVRELKDSIRKIESRGGRVILVRFPTSGPLRVAEERAYPRERYWNRMVEGLAALHFEDVPSLRSFSCPEGSHLDARDKVQFTAALARELKNRHWPGRFRTGDNN